MPIFDNISDKLFGNKDDEDQGPMSYTQNGEGEVEDGSYDQSFDADEGYGGETGSDRMPSKHSDTYYNPNEASTEITSSMDSTRTQNKNLSRMHGTEDDDDGEGFSWGSNN